MKHNKKYLLSLFALVLSLSCARTPQQNPSEKFLLLTPDLAAEKGKTSVVRIIGGKLFIEGNLLDLDAGSGFFVQPDKIVTNMHVVATPGPISVKLSDNETIWTVEGVAAFDIENDLVILKITGEGMPLRLGNSDAVKQRDTVYAIGYPGGGNYKLAMGTIHNSQYKDRWLQTTCDISKGYSGGPMLNNKGEVIGISTFKDDSYSYAAHSNILKALLSQSKQIEPLAQWYKRKQVRAYSYHERGEDKYNEKDYKAARTDLNKSIELDPQLMIAYATRGNIETDYAESIAKYGNIAKARIHYHTAISDYTKAIKSAPDNDTYYYGRGRARSFHGKYETKRGNTTEARKQYQAAIKDYTKAIKLDSDNDRNYSGRGWAMSLLGQLNTEQAEFSTARKQYQAAIRDYTKAIKLAPNDNSNYNGRGWVKYLLGRLKTQQGKAAEAQKHYYAAISDSDKALQLKSDNAFAYHTRGVAKDALREYNGAIEDFNIAIEHKSDFTEAYNSRGKAKEALGQHEAAEADFTRARQSLGKGTTSAQVLEKAALEMVRIPAGEFQMGSKEQRYEMPVHTVHLDAFYIDPYEVTNAQFKVFVDANPEWSKDNIPREYHNGDYLKHWTGNDYPDRKANHPVVYVSWYAAMAYAKWTDKRLPTEAEWEKAARGGVVGKRYVWGNSPDPNKANYGYYGKHTLPVGSYLPNGYGLHDIGGNVWELCLDEFDRNFYRNSPERNPVAGVSDIEALMENFTRVRTKRVSRGGSWATTDPAHVASRGSDTPTNTNGWLGFRCARSTAPEQNPQAVSSPSTPD